MKLNGAHIKIGEKIQKNRDKILGGTMIAIDPASRSLGYSVWQLGRMTDSGSIEAKGDIGQRLAYLHDCLEGLPQADVMVIEKIGQGRQAHHFLLWSQGAIAAALRAPVTIEIPPSLWRRFRDKDYIKSDLNDAMYIGRTAIALAK